MKKRPGSDKKKKSLSGSVKKKKILDLSAVCLMLDSAIFPSLCVLLGGMKRADHDRACVLC